MPLDSQFSLSLELTKLVPFGPLATAAGRGLLQLARSLKKTGSDIVVEEDLANIFGRNRIEPRFESTFRSVVRESSVKQLGALVDIVLHDGAGPTVHRSLSDRRYFSSVVQLSLLTWNLNLWSLSTGLSHALARRVEGAPLDQRDYPTVESLIGTLRACREQTSAFKWNLLFEAVDTVLSGSKLISKSNSNTRFSLPSTVLQGCLDFFVSTQHFPDDRIIRVRLSNRRAFSSSLLIVWAHHVLGMTVHVTNDDGSISSKFGTGKESLILILRNHTTPEDICLLEKSREEVFRIDEDHLAPEISSDSRVPARGYGTVWIDEHVDRIEPPLDPFKCFSYSVSSCMKNLERHGHSDFRSRTLRAAKFLFRELFDQFQLNDDLFQDDAYRRVYLEPLAGILTAFACVEDLDAAEDLPVSVKAINMKAFHGDYRNAYELMSCALLGTDLDTVGKESTSLISHCGWSLFSNIIALPDPSNTSRGLIRVQRGVPTRGGEQKRSIRDIQRKPVFLGLLMKNETPPQLPFTLNAFHVDKPSWYVGLTETAFEVGLWLETKDDDIQGMEQAMKDSERESIRRRPRYTSFTGLTALEKLGNDAICLPPCAHPNSALGSSYDLRPGCAVSKFPIANGCYVSKEGVPFQVTVEHPIIIFASAGNRWARWLALSYEENQKLFGVKRAGYIRHPNGCPECAMRTVKENMESRPNTSGVERKLAFIIL
jgi:hypothetical protein